LPLGDPEPIFTGKPASHRRDASSGWVLELEKTTAEQRPSFDPAMPVEAGIAATKPATSISSRRSCSCHRIPIDAMAAFTHADDIAYDGEQGIA